MKIVRFLVIWARVYVWISRFCEGMDPRVLCEVSLGFESTKVEPLTQKSKKWGVYTMKFAPLSKMIVCGTPYQAMMLFRMNSSITMAVTI